MDKGLEKSPINSYTKGIFISLLFSVLAIFVLAFLLKFMNMSDLVLKIINQVVKIIAIFIAVKTCVKDGKRGFLKGIIIGLSIAVLSFLLFALFTMSMDFGWLVIVDILVSAVIGGILGVIIVNLQK